MGIRARVDPVLLVWLTAFIVLAGALVATVFGKMAIFLYVAPMHFNETFYRLLKPVGTWWGAYTGACAGAIWCVGMLPIAMRRRITRLGRVGALLGLAVGSLSTVMLHVGFWLTAGRVVLGNLIVGLAFGIPVGAIVGAICGLICRNVVEKATRVPEQAETKTVT